MGRCDKLEAEKSSLQVKKNQLKEEINANKRAHQCQMGEKDAEAAAVEAQLSIVRREKMSWRRRRRSSLLSSERKMSRTTSSKRFSFSFSFDFSIVLLFWGLIALTPWSADCAHGPRFHGRGE
jgi:hypothetical protein